MELLNLPLELFERIIYLLVEDVGPTEAFVAGFACKTFSSAILDNIFKHQPLGSLFYNRGQSALHLFQARGADMMLTRLPKITVGFSRIAEALTDKIIGLNGNADRFIPKSYYIKHIYEAMISVTTVRTMIKILAGLECSDAMLIHRVDYLLPAAAAAVGELNTFRKLIRTNGDIFYSRSWILPSPFEAAAATGQAEVLQWIFGYIQAYDPISMDEYHKFPSKVPARRFLPRDFRSFVISSLRATIRRRQHETASLIWDFLCSGPIGHTVDYTCLDECGVVEDCMMYNHFELFQKIIRYRDSTSPVTLDPENPPAFREIELAYILSYASTTTFKKMLQAGMFSPDRIETYVPLNLALNIDRFDLAHLLLAQGADVNACDASGTSPLQYAVDKDHIVQTQLLIEHGADFTSISPCRVEIRGHRLCEKVAAEVARKESGLKMDTKAWRNLWYRWKDDSLLKSTWDSYVKNVVERG